MSGTDIPSLSTNLLSGQLCWTYIKARLFQYELPLTTYVPETSTHFFFDCSYNSGCLQAVTTWSGVKPNRKNILQVLPLNWPRKYCRNTFKRTVIYAAIAGLVYQMWKARNTSMWDKAVPSATSLVQILKFDVKHRILKFVITK